MPPQGEAVSYTEDATGTLVLPTKGSGVQYGANGMRSISCQALLFDLDGVLIDSVACVERHWRTWAAENQIKFERVMQFAHGRRAEETIRLVAPQLNAPAEAAKLGETEALDTDGVVAVHGADRLLSQLPQNRWAIVTTGPYRTATARIQRACLPSPAALVTGEDVEKGKPAPDAYLLAADRIGNDPDECIVIEDAPPGLSSARSAGMQVIGVCSTHSSEELADADIIVPRLSSIHVAYSAGRGELHVTTHKVEERVNSDRENFPGF
jgi:sugar-phosphatase